MSSSNTATGGNNSASPSSPSRPRADSVFSGGPGDTTDVADDNDQELQAMTSGNEAAAEHTEEAEAALRNRSPHQQQPLQPQPQPSAKVLSAAAVAAMANPYGGDEDEACGICLETPGPGKLVTLLCCRNVLCIKDVQSVGVCPFCRVEPLAWSIKS